MVSTSSCTGYTWFYEAANTALPGDGEEWMREDSFYINENLLIHVAPVALYNATLSWCRRPQSVSVMNRSRIRTSQEHSLPLSKNERFLFSLSLGGMFNVFPLPPSLSQKVKANFREKPPIQWVPPSVSFRLVTF
ncbi:hypothetical protein VNO77_27498 [Canavalia gladiata]|uniref:Uncharacterized protein n=1 Tax=Canavalia gladiata TaxID=3824 RepID=A0AAN9KXY9_CANGL